MTSSPWLAAGVGAIVAVATTLVVELVFRPSLEIRKDRKRTSARERDSLLRRFAQISAKIDAFHRAVGTYREPQLTDQLIAEMRELDGDGRMLFRHLPREIVSLINEQTASVSVIFFANDLFLNHYRESDRNPSMRHSDRWLAQIGKNVPQDVFALTLDYLDTPWWRIRRRQAIRRTAHLEAERMIDASGEIRSSSRTSMQRKGGSWVRRW